MSSDSHKPVKFGGQGKTLTKTELRAVKAETRADAAELLAKERAERIEDLRRMLPPPEQAKKRWWWQRG